MEIPKIKVGIMSEKSISFSLQGEYYCSGNIVGNSQVATIHENKIYWNNKYFDEIEFVPTDEKDSSFELQGVTIGVGFHWERKENQTFRGSLKLIVIDGKITAINILSIAEYLLSVSSSEMSSTASLNLRKSHAVISRVWLLA